MNFEIIKVSEAIGDAKTWDDEDRDYIGIIPGFKAGFNFETRNTRTGEINYMSVVYIPVDPDLILNLNEFYVEENGTMFDMLKLNDQELTGRAIFRGYGREYYNPEFNEFYIADCHNAALQSLINVE